MLLAGLQIPKSSSTTKIKIKPKPVLLEHSWSQVLDKAQKFPKQGDAEGVSGITPSLSSTTGSLGLISHLPPSLSQCSSANSRAEGKRQGEWVLRMHLGSTVLHSQGGIRTGRSDPLFLGR